MWNLHLLSSCVLCSLFLLLLTLASASKIPYERRTFLNSDKIQFPKDVDELTPQRPREAGYSYPDIMFPKLTTSQEHLASVNIRETFKSDGRMLPLELAIQVSQFDDIRDLIKKHFEDPDGIVYPNNNALSIESRFGGEPSSEPNVKVPYPPFATCKALPEVVSLEPNNPLVHTLYMPACTRVLRCSGCCLSDILKCQPTDVEVKTFYVMEARYFANVSKFKFIANREVQVEEHKDCRCACSMKEEECKENQRFEESRCRCYCRNLKEEMQCTSRLHRWDEKSCQCICRQQLTCTASRHFDPVRCRCVRGRGNNPEIVDLS